MSATSLRTASKSHPRKQVLVTEHILGIARKYGPGMKLPTARELTQQLGITITTLDRSLKRLEERGFITRKQGSGIYVSPEVRKKRIGLVFGHNIFSEGNSPFYRELLNQCEKRAASNDVSFSFFLDNPSLSGVAEGKVHRDLEDALLRKRLDGLLVAQKRGPAHDKLIRSFGTPSVFLSAKSEGPGWVKLDTKELINLCVDSMHEQGCKTFGMIALPPTWHRQYFEDALGRIGVPIQQEFVICPEISGYAGASESERYEQLGRDFLDELWLQAKGKLPDCLVVTNDWLTRGICKQLERRGVSIGSDIKIATHANRQCHILREWEPVLTLCEFDVSEIVAAMFSELGVLMEQPDTERPPALIKPRLVPSLTPSLSH